MPTEKVCWGEGTPWKNSTAFFTYLRGCLRKAWSRHPTKLNVIKKQRKQITNPNPKGNKPTVFGFTCELCEKDHVLKDGQVDHINPAGTLTKTDDIQGFVERLLYVREEDLRLVCKGCNSAMVIAEKQGIRYEMAIVEQKVIAICKQSAKLIDTFLAENGEVSYTKNPASRRDAVRRVLLSQQQEKEKDENVD